MSSPNFVPQTSVQNVMRSNSDIDIEISQSSSPDGFGYLNRFPNNYTRLAMIPKYSTADMKPLYVVKDYNSDSSLLMTSENAKMAGMKIFATVMLGAWRRRRAECKLLNSKIEELKDLSMKARNQLHVYNTLFRVEQQRNDELTCKLKRSMENISEAKSSCEGLTTSLISLKADHALLEEELRNKYQENENINALLAQSKSDLYRAVVEQKALKASVAKEQRNKQFLENQKNKLISEVCELNEENQKKEEKYRKELLKKCDDLSQAREKEKQLLQDIEEWKTKFLQLTEKRTEEEIMLRREAQVLRVRCGTMQEELAKSFGAHFKGYCNKLYRFQMTILQAAHIITFWLLPAMPRPSATFGGKRPWIKL